MLYEVITIARSTRPSVPAIFVDTGAFYAVADSADRNHAAARNVFETRGMAGDLVTSDYSYNFV